MSFMNRYKGMTSEEVKLAVTEDEYAALAEMGAKLYEDTSEARRELRANPPRGCEGFIAWLDLLFARLSSDFSREELYLLLSIGMKGDRILIEKCKADFADFREASYAAEALGITMREAILGELTRRRNRAGQSFAEEIQSRGVSLDEAIRQGFAGGRRYSGTVFTLDDDDTSEGTAATASRTGESLIVIRHGWRDAVRRSVGGARTFAKKNVI